jgi:CheY-like chemotaxis protein/anti-sigma regulatory factor (Ser/Thr protein kinase)
MPWRCGARPRAQGAAYTNTCEARSSGGPSARARGGSLTLEIDPAVPDRLWFDPIQIRQCLDNLIQNAISHAPGGAIATRAHARRLRGESWVLVIAVADQGPGVPAPLREQIFAPYVRGPARADAQGSGLGLAVVRRIARRHGGEVTLSHPAEGGACFEVAIHAAPPIRPHRNGQPVRRGAGASRARVLIVDDDPINRAVTVHMLASLDLALEEAATGAEALAAAHARAPDLVLLDVHLEDMDGEAVLAALRAMPAPPHVVLITGDPRIGALIGARATLLKPLDIAQLRHEVCAALDVGAPG